MRDIITIGAATRDVFLLSDRFQLIRSEKFENGVGECVPLGSKIDIDQKVETTGGGATNAAVTFARLGFKTAAICRVGDDASGREIVVDLGREKVDTTLMRHVRNGETAYSVLLTAKGGERSILTYRGVSGEFKAADIPWDALNAHWIYLTSLGGNHALAARIAKQAARHGTLLAWNPGGKEMDTGLSAWRQILPSISLLLLNREEAEKLTGSSEPADAYHKLYVAGARGHVVITNGEKGSDAFSGKQAWHSGTTDAPSLSRAGAGDAFGSALVAGLFKGFSLPQALALGTLNAESVVGHIGAKHGILKKWPTPPMLARVPVKSLIL